MLREMSVYGGLSPKERLAGVWPFWLNISGATTKLTAGRRIGYVTPVRTEFKNSNFKLCTDEVDIESCSYPNKVNSVESFYTDDGLSSCSNFPSVKENAAPNEESAVPKLNIHRKN